MNTTAGTFAAVAIALEIGHHVGDYWVQTDHQAKHKGEHGHAGRRACLAHVVSYMLTQWVLLEVASVALGLHLSFWGTSGALAVSGITHYMADRREYGAMFALARRIPGKAAFMKLGVPRKSEIWDGRSYDDNPQLATGAWALDQSWHLLWGVFVAALLAVLL